MTDEQFEKLFLTSEQIKAADAVYEAMKKAHKAGVSFWDNYGTLSAYNAKKIGLPVPTLPAYRKRKSHSLSEYDVSYSRAVPNFSAGNADDELFYDEL